MGICLSCFKASSADITPPSVDVTVKRQQMAEAAERRIQQQENRGIKDLGKVKRLQQKREELDKELAAAGPQPEGNLRWQVQ
uniref:Small VCP/p97-interacting protein n=2 Tax=Amblyomma TaxID=6942 RepID=A0A023FP68_AMBCJ